MRKNQAGHQSPVQVKMTGGTDRGRDRVNTDMENTQLAIQHDTTKLYKDMQYCTEIYAE